MRVEDADGGVGFRIESLYAYLAVHEQDGDEGVAGMRTIGGGSIPMIAADKTRLDLLRPIAVEMARVAPMPIILVQFTHRIDLETL